MVQTLKYLALCARIKGLDFVSDEKGEVNIVATVVLCGIAVLLAMLFKEKIGDLLSQLLKTISGNATNVATEQL